MKRNFNQTKEILEHFYQLHNRRGSIGEDPIQFPHRYDVPEDIEIAGFIASSFAFGRVASSLPFINTILGVMGKSPHQFVMDFRIPKDLDLFNGLYYRIWSQRDIACLIYVTQNLLKRYRTLGSCFTRCFYGNGETVEGALSKFIEEVSKIDPSPIYGENTYPASFIHLLPSPKRGSACKRLNLYLRWMIRNGDGVDFGIWTKIPPSKLIIPLDAHIIRISRYLGFHHRKTPNWKMAVDITQHLKKFDPHDPVKYDFALCHLGISGKCTIQPNYSLCLSCKLQALCSRFKRLHRNRIKRVKYFQEPIKKTSPALSPG